ncbi:DUF86 domain-containing protein [Paenibacillus sacheonensis]|uniref:DUF86 domain-containing protein n=1 Tax=Paenibacillus sacheonensis TaxID=742054 RepID=A0A7X4YK04_9BACL|nr:HepT-like ribonuclease domain-containing protein [Paenibacillus sacheonensis]MBM7563839.1 uncharacterized protein YutE (UPF0331/DUF86 family) [Paenibacillus sacheonensis]NBC67811.1 DUF86 domain-containing protein [Paenibacillus sacheonensis]
MYYVNREQISVRLEVIPEVAEALKYLQSHWDGSLIHGMAQERALILAIETLTDIGSYLIDGFIMRDASSYEDIVTIIAGEEVFPDSLQEPLLELVKLRRPLVQDYFEWPRKELHPFTAMMPDLLLAFKEAVESYLLRELGN